MLSTDSFSFPDNTSNLISQLGVGIGRKSVRRRDFHYKHGQKHHSYDSEKAPYPLSYDKNVLELQGLDNRLAQYLANSISFAKFDKPPARVLDLGCGTGAWIIDAAKFWPHCEFVGFDLVDVQIPLAYLDSSISTRIEWKHGNFLTTKLPFEDDEFDHVHIQSIATGVPESKWGVLFDEVSRVLRPGGSVEVIEDDIIFPSLPRWFTQALRNRPRQFTRHPERPSEFSSSPPRHPTSISTIDASYDIEVPSHDHALIESLYNSIFDNRFINMRPTSVLPNYLTTYFRQVTLGPVLSFPMPPFAPMMPLPPQTVTSYVVEPSIDGISSRTSVVGPSTSTFTVNRPVSLSFSSAMSTATASSSNDLKSYASRPRTSSAPLSYKGSTISSLEMAHSNDSEATLNIDITTKAARRYMLDNSVGDIEEGNPRNSPFPLDKLNELTERSIAMHLYRSYQVVLACQEAMWEELKDRIRNRKHELQPFGWDDDEELEELQSRKKFELLMDRYKADMKFRVALWYSLNDLDWPFPVRDPMSKAELFEQQRMQMSMMEARKQATLEEMQQPSRAVRVLIGYNL
ncbi:hypothetical protein D9613_002243 [Agrocybe pediades]|uniref:Methyltransferase domain-containing protein n=1 Tax=Agrocybe pediades TaxID=84607 RepID=A0A8H4R670_9AGAR|nr:hypothetical protein D9613_002243 [Agrocybe pediades]